MNYLSSAVNTLSGAVGSVSQTRVFQWSINKVRENVYPVYYNHNAWEADLIVENHNIWLGGLPSACDRSALRVRNITRIITAVYDLNPIFPHDPDLIYLKIPVLDAPSEEIAAHFDKAIDFISESVKNGHGVLIHCVYGISRSSTLMCAYLMRKHGMSQRSAIQYVKTKRPQVDPNSGFLLQLATYEKRKDYSYFPELDSPPTKSLATSPKDPSVIDLFSEYDSD
jgi:hypothetical protein